MDLYILDQATFAQKDTVDDFESLIWTERYNEAGEVTLVVSSTINNKITFVEGMFLWTPESREVAMVETVTDADGALTIQGIFLPGFLQQRILRDTWGTAKTNWSLTGSAGDIAATIVREMCTSSGKIATNVLPGTNGAYEPIPNLVIATAPSGTSMTVAVDYGNVYDGVKAVCDLDDLGFTLYPPDISDGTGTVSFLTYRGRDLTSAQSTYPVVAFDPALDSLTDVTSIRSLAGYKTAAYAWANGLTAQSQIGTAFAAGMATTVGWRRRSLMVDASDVNATDYTAAELTSILNKRAQNELANNNYVRMTDGQLVPQNAFTYGIDYILGDVVELRGNGATADSARITEYIRAQDSEGYRAYPTLSVI